MLNLKKLEHILLFAVVLFIPTQIGKHYWLDFSYIYSLPVDYLSPTLFLWDILVVLLFLVFIISGGKVNKLALNLFFLFILTQTASLFSKFATVGVGLVRLEQYFLAGLFGVYIASLKKDQIKQFIPIMFWAIFCSIFFESLLATFQFLKSETLGFWIFGERTFSISTPGISKFDYHGREFLRPYATFPHPNVLAAFAIIGPIIMLHLKDLWADGFKKVQIRQIMLITMITSIITVLLTVSRVALISGLMFLITFFTKNRDRLLIIIATLVLLPVLYTRFSSLINFDSLTFIRREELSLIAIKLWNVSKIFGVGLNNFIPTASDLLLAGPNRFLQPVHDIFLLSLAETGIIGLLGFLILIGLPILRLKKLKVHVPLYHLYSLWIIIIFLGLFDHYFLTLPQGYRLLFFVWGLTIRD